MIIQRRVPPGAQCPPGGHQGAVPVRSARPALCRSMAGGGYAGLRQSAYDAATRGAVVARGGVGGHRSRGGNGDQPGDRRVLLDADLDPGGAGLSRWRCRYGSRPGRRYLQEASDALLGSLRRRRPDQRHLEPSLRTARRGRWSLVDHAVQPHSVVGARHRPYLVAGRVCAAGSSGKGGRPSRSGQEPPGLRRRRVAGRHRDAAPCQAVRHRGARALAPSTPCGSSSLVTPATSARFACDQHRAVRSERSTLPNRAVNSARSAPWARP